MHFNTWITQKYVAKNAHNVRTKSLSIDLVKSPIFQTVLSVQELIFADIVTSKLKLKLTIVTVTIMNWAIVNMYTFHSFTMEDTPCPIIVEYTYFMASP